MNLLIYLLFNWQTKSLCEVWGSYTGVHKDSCLLGLTPCELLNSYGHLQRICCLHCQGLSILAGWWLHLWTNFLFTASCFLMFYYILGLIHVVVSYFLWGQKIICHSLTGKCLMNCTIHLALCVTNNLHYMYKCNY